jgi:hypothetical protein
MATPQIGQKDLDIQFSEITVPVKGDADVCSIGPTVETRTIETLFAGMKSTRLIEQPGAAPGRRLQDPLQSIWIQISGK